MAGIRRKHSAQFKFKVALAAAKGHKTINEIASEYNLHPNQVSNWKKQLMTEGPVVFSSDTVRGLQEQESRETELYEQSCSKVCRTNLRLVSVQRNFLKSIWLLLLHLGTLSKI